LLAKQLLAQPREGPKESMTLAMLAQGLARERARLLKQGRTSPDALFAKLAPKPGGTPHTPTPYSTWRGRPFAQPRPLKFLGLLSLGTFALEVSSTLGSRTVEVEGEVVAGPHAAERSTKKLRA